MSFLGYPGLSPILSLFPFDPPPPTFPLQAYRKYGVSFAYWLFYPFAFYSDERVLFVFEICFLHLELEGSMRDSIFAVALRLFQVLSSCLSSVSLLRSIVIYP